MAGQPIVGDFGLESPLTIVPPMPRGTRVAWYKPNHRSFGAFMRSEQMRGVTAEVAVDIAILAHQLTPVGTEPHDEGSDQRPLRDRFEMKREAGLMEVDGNLRVKVEVVNDAEYAAAVEFGLSRSNQIGARGRRMLLRAGAQFGDVKLPEGEGA
jgi:hypothetical protein